MPSRILATPFLIIAIILAAFAYLNDGAGAIWIAPNFIILAVIYSLHPQIDWYWYEKHPPEMDERLLAHVQRLSPFYQQLNQADQKKFRNRVQLYLQANEFLLRGIEDNITPPDDLKALFAIPVVEITFNEVVNWRLKKFERLVLYPTSFPSPNNHELHACEIETEDGVIIVALDLAQIWVDHPAQRFPIMHYAVAQAFLWTFIEKRNQLKQEIEHSTIEQMTGFKEEEIQQIIGSQEIDTAALSLAYYIRSASHINKLSQ